MASLSSEDGARRLARELADLTKDESLRTALSGTPVADLQLLVCRKLRELIPVQKDVLLHAQQHNWMEPLLSWLNLHDQPAVQVEALLVLTNVAELCAQQSFLQHTAQQTSAVTAAAQAAVSAVKGGTGSSDLVFGKDLVNKYAGPGAAAGSKYPYPPLVAPGSVPFPPLSFRQTLSSDAMSALDASLSSTIQSQAAQRGDKASVSMPLPPATGGINFTSLAPPPGGAHSSVPSNAFLPPPTPVASSSSTTFPQHLSASSQHLLLRHADAIPTLISLLVNPNRQVYEQAMWILGSIAAGDAPPAGATADKTVSARDVILAAGVMDELIRCLETHVSNLTLQRIGSWTLSNLVDGIFQQKTSSVGAKSSDVSSSGEIDMTKLLPTVRRLLNMSDSEVLSYTCWTLSHLCDGPSSHIAAIVTTPLSMTDAAPKGGLVPRLVELLLHASWRVTKPALRTIGNIVCAECGDEASATDYTEVILECNAVPRLKELVTHSNREIQKEACWTLSNIAAGTIPQIQAVIDSGAIPPLVQLVSDKKTDQEVRSEACWVVLNATSCGSDNQIETLVDEGCVPVLGVLLPEANMVLMALEGLERVLQVEEAREATRREKIRLGEIEDSDSNRTPVLVSAALIEKARDSHSSTSKIHKRADNIWKDHFVACALCQQSFSKHRPDASFCEECKCYVCNKGCNCRIYHLDYQEELWAATEEETNAKKNAKKSKNKKKKEKLKQKKAKQAQEPDAQQPEPPVALSPGHDKDTTKSVEVEFIEEDPVPFVAPVAPIDSENQIDFVLYLQQTGSMIALAKLMDALDGAGEELDEYERKIIREQNLLRGRTHT